MEAIDNFKGGYNNRNANVSGRIVPLKKRFLHVERQLSSLIDKSFGMTFQGIQISVFFLSLVLFSDENTFCLIPIICAASWENRVFAFAKTKTQISFAVTAKLICVFVFATQIVQYFFFLNTKFQASRHIL